ncbi:MULTISPECIES: phosphoethanolamine transferase domain-containing protein [Halomonadaceae]|uniref:phosphoethanolamine transferase domain-containing protein n=1 Tax=Halomonadaceae TaxID=28256 RepID=UPI0020C6893F|nr:MULTISPECIES: DUF1705 domain-containing protein [Halomonas]
MHERFRMATTWLASLARPSLTLSPERLTLLVCLVFTLFYQQAFWQQVMAAEPALTAWQLLAYGLVLTGLQFIVFVLFVTRHTAKPLLSALILLAATVSYYTGHYGTYFDTHMIDNVLQTDTKEAGELLTPGFAVYLLLYAGLPMALLWRVRLSASTWPRALGRRFAYLAGGGGDAGSGADGVLSEPVITDAQPYRAALPGHSGQCPDFLRSGAGGK